MAISLSKGLKPIFGLKNENHGSNNIEGFLTAVGKTLLKEAFICRRFERPNKKSREIYEVLQKLKNSGSVCLPTDNTNSTRLTQFRDYKQWVCDFLLKATDLALHPKAIALFEDAKKLLEKVKMYLSVQEENFVRQSLATRAIPSPRLLIKVHNTTNKKGELPTRLATPATKFTATFSKIGYLGIKRMLDKAKVKY